MELYVAEESQVFGFGYTNDTCLWDQFMTNFGLFMGFVTIKENMKSLQFILELNFQNRTNAFNINRCIF